MSAPLASSTDTSKGATIPHDAHHLPSPGLLTTSLRRPRARAERTVDWLRVAVWTAALGISCTVWGGIALAIAALVR
jgi:hypothetical protein